MRSTPSSTKALMQPAKVRSKSKGVARATSGPSASRNHRSTAPPLLRRTSLACGLALKIRRDFFQGQRAQFRSIPPRHGVGWISRRYERARLENRLDDVLVNGLRLASICKIVQPLRCGSPKHEGRTDTTISSGNAGNVMAHGTSGAGEDDGDRLVA